MANLLGDLPPAPAETTSQDDPLETVKQKFKTETGELDVAALAKGKVESDKHITNLESELRGLRKELDTRLNYEQFLDEIKSSKAPAVDNQTTQPEVKALGKDEIAALVRDAVKQERTQAQKDDNIRQVQQTLAKVWSGDYREKLQAKIQELGVSVEFASSIAEANPSAFLKLVDATPPAQNRTTPGIAPPANQRPSLQNANSGVRDFAYYEKLRKSEPGRYWSVSTQKQMHNDMFEQGEDFLKGY